MPIKDCNPIFSGLGYAPAETNDGIGDWLGNGNSRCNQEIDWSRDRWHEVSL
jgi:hypothetical protein